MKTKISYFLISVFTLLTSSCVFVLSMENVKPSGDVIKETRIVDDFINVSVSQGLHAIITQGEKTSVVVEANENFLEYIVVEVNDNTLRIKLKDKIGLKGGTKNIHVVVSNLKKIKTSSGAHTETIGMFKGENMHVSVSSGGHADLSIEASDVECDASSGGHISLKGKTLEHLEADASSGAHINASNFDGESLDGEASSGGHIKVGTFKKIDAKASSGGHISYSGTPESLNVNKSSGGSVSKR